MQFRCSVCVLSSEKGVHAKNLHLEYHMLSQHKPATLHTGAKLVLEQPILILTFSSSLNLRAWLIQSHASSKFPRLQHA